MRTFKFIPAYYEWHLIDTETDEVVYVLDDPTEDLYYEDGTPLPEDAIADFLVSDLKNSNDPANDECNHILVDTPLTPEEIHEAAKLMANTLFSHYLQ